MKILKYLLFATMFVLSISCVKEDQLLGDVFHLDSEETICEQYQTQLTTATTAFQASTMADYTDNCNAYKTALQNVIITCGDSTGFYTATIQALGDCSQANDCLSYETATIVAENNFNNATSNDYTSTCNAYKAALQNQIDNCGDVSGTLQAEYDSLGNCIDPATAACNAAETATLAAETAFDNNTDPNMYTALCNAYKTALQAQVTACGDNNGALAAEIATLGNCMP